MFGEPLFSASRHARHALPQLASEFVATFRLLAVICDTFAGTRRADAPAFIRAQLAGAGPPRRSSGG
jgi:hypothetical protein